MIHIARKLLALLTAHERRCLALLLGMILVMGLLDMVSVAAIGPFLQVLANPETTGSPVIDWARMILQPGSTQALLTWLAAIALVLVVFSLAFKTLTIYALTRFSHMRAFSLSKRLLSAYLRQPYSWSQCRPRKGCAFRGRQGGHHGARTRLAGACAIRGCLRAGAAPFCH